MSRLDAWWCWRERERIAQNIEGCAVDVGIGEHPWTTLEWAEALRAIQPAMIAIGVEHDSKRLEAAQEHETSSVRFRPSLGQGTWEVPLFPGERPLFVRCMNVLRGYPKHMVSRAHAALGASLIEGGLLVEGSCSPKGHVLCAHVLRKTAQNLDHEGLLFSTDFARGFAPMFFRDWLPRDLRRDVRPGTPIHRFLTSWTAAWNEVREVAREPAAAFVASAKRLAETSSIQLELASEALEEGNLLWLIPHKP